MLVSALEKKRLAEEQDKEKKLLAEEEDKEKKRLAEEEDKEKKRLPEEQERCRIAKANAHAVHRSIFFFICNEI